eukprot:Skav201046  [mRNA]  locus=scaffold3386:315602:337685:- [translate_table: standard]
MWLRPFLPVYVILLDGVAATRHAMHVEQKVELVPAMLSRAVRIALKQSRKAVAKAETLQAASSAMRKEAVQKEESAKNRNNEIKDLMAKTREKEQRLLAKQQEVSKLMVTHNESQAEWRMQPAEDTEGPTVEKDRCSGFGQAIGGAVDSSTARCVVETVRGRAVQGPFMSGSGPARAAYLRLESEVRDLRALVLQLQERISLLEIQGSTRSTPFPTIVNSPGAVIGASLPSDRPVRRNGSESPNFRLPIYTSEEHVEIRDLERVEVLAQIGHWIEAALRGNRLGLSGRERLAEGSGANMEEYLQSYEKMLQEGIAPEMAPLDQAYHEGGITTRPEPGFVVKTRDNAAGTKIFINIVSSPHIEAALNVHAAMVLPPQAPHMKSYTELEGEQGCRVPLSIGTPVEAGDALLSNVKNSLKPILPGGFRQKG